MRSTLLLRDETDIRSYEVICGDSAEVLRTHDARSIDLVVTSPPYFRQRSYTSEGLGNEATVDEYLNNLVCTFSKILPLMKPTGSIVYNLGDKIVGGSAQLVPYQFALKVLHQFNLRLVNDITWVKSNPTPHQFSRRLIASTEPFFHFALGKDYYYDRDSFLPAEQKKPRSRPTDKLGSRYRKLIEESALNADERTAAHKALDEVISEVRNGEIHSFRMKIRDIHAPAYGGQDGGRKMRIEKYGFTIIRISGNPLKRDVIESPVESLPGNGHPAIFPVRVVRELVRMLCPEGGTVLDPYVGSGSTMVAALMEGRNCIGIDISPEYCKSSLSRIRHSVEKLKTLL